MAGRFDITIEQGAVLSLPLTLKNTNGTAFDLTGYTGRGQIRKFHRSTSIIASFTVTIPTTGELITSGKLTVSLTAIETAAISAGEEITDEKSKYVYDLEIISGATVKRILEGFVFVSPEVTR
jgi:hypothetical protein